MSKYASLLFGPEKYYEVGPFRFPIYHDLVPGESKGIETITRAQSKSTFASIKLAQRIAKDKGITTKEAVELLGNQSTDNEELLYDYVDELEDLQLKTPGAIEQQIAFVTLFMRYRAEVKLPRSKTWESVPDWDERDTESMPSKTMEEVFKLIMWERDGWPDAGEEEEEGNAERAAQS